MNCKATCPAGVQVSEIVESTRRRLVKEGLLPEIHKALLRNISEYGNPFREAAEKRTDIYPSTYHQAKEAETLLFFGCVTSYQDVQIIPNTIKILNKVGIDFTTMGNEEYCCGYLAYLTGSEKFGEFIQRNLKWFSRSRSKRIVTTCAGCYKTFKELYPKSAEFNLEVLHVVEYMDQLISEGKWRWEKPFNKKVIYHDPCDLGRHMNVYEPPRKVLQAIPGIQLIEFKENRNLARCCGGGGGLKAFDNDLSGDIAYRRTLEAIDLGAEVIVSACPSCKSSFQQAAAKLRREKKGSLKVMDITEIVAEVL
jgi:glycolate oxidase